MVHSRLAKAGWSSLLAASPRRRANVPARSSSVLAPNVLGPPPSSPSTSGDRVRDSRLVGLRRALLNESNPARVWAHYTNFISYFGGDVIPLELHQQVLRQCTPPANRVRVSAARRLIEGRKPENPHLYEGRFQTVISNIRATGRTPPLDDYHFILEHFAAVGHHIGCLQIYQEILHLGLTPEPKTFGLCLQAIAHRFTLPILQFYRPRLVAQTRKILEDLMSDMHRYNIPFTQTNIDLSLRIFKETTDEEGFYTLVKWAYGIDLTNPDCPPVELLEAPSESHPPSILPLTTQALNTIIDTLGRFRNMSKLVQTFEVLTQPLPRANQHLFSSFDDDDDFGVSVEVLTPPNYSPPYALPNTTTYRMLLHHIGQANHAILARHYLIQAMRLDREVHHELWSHIEKEKRPIKELKAPHFAINRKMLLSVFGHTNRRKNLGLMRWLHTKMPRIIRTKRLDLEYFTNLQETLGGPVPQSTIDANTRTEGTGLAASTPPHDLTMLRSLIVPSRPTTSSTIEVDPAKFGTAFEVDVNDQTIPEPQADKMFDLDLHIRILTRDLEQIMHFAETIDRVLGRTTQRLKERLGRRVWGEKDIYLLDENRRTRVSREHWREIVGFRPRRDILARQKEIDMRLRNTAPRPQTSRSFTTLVGSPTDISRPSPFSVLATKLPSIWPS